MEGRKKLLITGWFLRYLADLWVVWLISGWFGSFIGRLTGLRVVWSLTANKGKLLLVLLLRHSSFNQKFCVVEKQNMYLLVFTSESRTIELCIFTITAVGLFQKIL